MDVSDLPRPFVMALTQSRSAMRCFSAMTEAQQQAVAGLAMTATTRAEMRSAVGCLARRHKQ
ncbi:MAG: hypothetical protein IJQ17_05605 [Oscillospiraceae bacterium]|nr:hypothetical protein [Oscillospiraceae bacterium]MBQ6974282.1 hypothetical protein [Oscillospiraceae bacterium]